MRAAIRLTRILQVVAAGATGGLTLAELAHKCELDKATALRLARALGETGWLVRCAESGRFRLGAEAWLAGRRGSPQLDALARAAPRQLNALARATGDTAYLAVRSGSEMVFVARAEGSAPIRAKVDVGHRQTLAVGAAAMAWLAAVGDDHAVATLRQLRPRMRALAIDPDAVARLIARARERGYAYSKGHVFFGVPAVGLAIRSPQGHPVGAISLAANAERLTGAHVQFVLPALRRAVQSLEKSLLSAH
jgi:DNA-binding IclR family transcriptional regulator